MQETQETRVRSLGREDPLEEEMATHSSILVWEIPRTEDPGGLHSMGSQRVTQDLVAEHARTFICPTVLCPIESSPDRRGTVSTICSEQDHGIGATGHQTIRESLAGSSQAVEIQVQGGSLWRAGRYAQGTAVRRPELCFLQGNQ